MRKALLVLLAAVGAAYIGYRIGDATASCFNVRAQPVEQAQAPDSGAIGGEGSCELSWAYCWVRT